MAFLFMDGFDHYGFGVSPAQAGISKWSSAGSGTATLNSQARTGSYSLRCTSSSYLVSNAYSTSGGAVVGIGIYLTGTPASGAALLQIFDSGTVHIDLGITTGRILTIKRGSTLIATGTTVLSLNSWYYIELKTVIHDTTGTYEVKIDGVSEAALTATGADTRNGATGVWNAILLGNLGSGGPEVYFDDVYVCDTSGSSPRNNFLGAIKIELLMPQTDAVDAGSNAGLTPSTGTDHGALVDEIGPNDTDYNGSATVGAKDTYEYPAMTLTGTVYGVQTNMYVAKSDAGARTVCPVVRTASTDTDGTAISPTTTFAYSTQMWQQDPNAGSPIEWTTANIATMQAGMKVVS